MTRSFLLYAFFAVFQLRPCWAGAQVESVFHVNSNPLSSKTKIFLIAGSSITPAFAQEVVDQRKLWLAAGFKEEEIACYYVVPLQEDFNDGKKQFSGLAAELAKCHPASMKILREHLKTVAREHPPFLYLYVTSHGDQPVSRTIKEAKSSDDDYWVLQREMRYPIFEQYQILIEGLPDGTATSSEILGALRAGMSPNDLYLTPSSLKEILDSGFSDVPKFIVFQGCFSGGFFEDEVAANRKDLLSLLPRITLLSASRHDRSSFGCEPGSRTTYFGGVFNDRLSRVLGDPRRLDWRRLYSDVQLEITRLEKRQKAVPSSLPQFFQTVR